MPLRLDAGQDGFAQAFEDLLDARREAGVDVRDDVAAIVAQVKSEGDAALIALTAKFDRLELTADQLRVSPEEIAAARALCDPDAVAALEMARARIIAYHERQKPEDFDYVDDTGIRLGSTWRAVSAAGLYVPGGTAAYPSSVLMNAVPARVAGVERLVMVVPSPDGVLNPLVLAAADIAGVDEVYRVGGAQAVAALAYGTDTIAPVDKIVGPGNAFVNEAKRQVFGPVGIDQLASPSEIYILADHTGDAEMIATDLLAQAEHDVRTRVGLITTDPALAQAVEDEVARQLTVLKTSETAGQAWRDYGEIAICEDEAAMIAYSDFIAAEHLQIHTENPKDMATKLRNYGSLFIGELASVVYSDKCCGTNHTLPTMAAGRYTGGLWVGAFVKTCTHQWMEPEGVNAVAPPAVRQSTSEGLDGHRRAAQLRLDRLQAQ